MTFGDMFAQYADSPRYETDTVGASLATPSDPKPNAAEDTMAQVSLMLQSAMTLLARVSDQIEPVFEAAAAGFDTLAEIAGMSGNRMEDWLAEAKAYDVPADELVSAVNSVRAASERSRADDEGENGEPWRSLGVSFQANPFDVLDRISERIKELEPDYARSLLADVGMGDNMFRLLQQRDSASGGGAGEGEAGGGVGLIRNIAKAVSGQALGLEALNDGIQGTGDQSTETLVNGVASGSRLRDMLQAITEPTKLLLTLFESAYEIPTGAGGGGRDILANVKEAFGKWEKIDPEEYASTMIDYLKTQALPVVSAATVASGGAAPLGNINVTQYIDSDGDARDVARRITDEIEAAGRQYPSASY